MSFLPGQVLFQGEYRAAMHELVGTGYRPCSPADIMDARNVVSYAHRLWNKDIATDFGIVGVNHKIYLLPHSSHLQTINLSKKLTNGGLAVDSAATQNALVHDRGDLILGRDLSEEEARQSLIWFDLAEGDQDRLDMYVENVFRFGRDAFGYDYMMGILAPKETPVERAVVLGSGLVSKFYSSGNYLNCRTNLIGKKPDLFPLNLSIINPSPELVQATTSLAAAYEYYYFVL